MIFVRSKGFVVVSPYDLFALSRINELLSVLYKPQFSIPILLSVDVASTSLILSPIKPSWLKSILKFDSSFSN